MADDVAKRLVDGVHPPSILLFQSIQLFVIRSSYFQDVSLLVARPRHEPDRFRFPEFLWILSPKTELKSDEKCQ